MDSPMFSWEVQGWVTTFIPGINVTPSHQQQLSSLQITLPDSIMQGTQPLGYRFIDLGPTRQQDADLVKWDHADNAVCQFPLQGVGDAFSGHFSSVHTNPRRSQMRNQTIKKCYITKYPIKPEGRYCKDSIMITTKMGTFKDKAGTAAMHLINLNSLNNVLLLGLLGPW